MENQSNISLVYSTKWLPKDMSFRFIALLKYRRYSTQTFNVELGTSAWVGVVANSFILSHHRKDLNPIRINQLVVSLEQNVLVLWYPSVHVVLCKFQLWYPKGLVKDTTFGSLLLLPLYTQGPPMQTSYVGAHNTNANQGCYKLPLQYLFRCF